MGKHGKAKKKRHKRDDVPAVIAPTEDAPKIKTADGSFDLEDPALPDWIEESALASGGYPYADKMPDEDYEKTLTALQVELVKLQRHINDTGGRVVALFEGRDAAGKGGAIFAMRQYMNPRTARAVALPKPTDREAGEWYFQRYVAELPSKGEIVLFDRSWYNRGGVEPVMGFCTAEQTAAFLRQAPTFERMLIEDGIHFFKFWLEIGRPMQMKRFHERRHNPLKIWKLSPVDFAALTKWDEYTAARERMLDATDTKATPWTVVRANDKHRARLAIIRRILAALDYRGKDAGIVDKPDPKVLGGRGLAKAR